MPIEQTTSILIRDGVDLFVRDGVSTLSTQTFGRSEERITTLIVTATPGRISESSDWAKGGKQDKLLTLGVS